MNIDKIDKNGHRDGSVTFLPQRTHKKHRFAFQINYFVVRRLEKRSGVSE